MSTTKEIYLAANGQLQMEVAFAEETAWLFQAQMAVLFDTSTDNIGLHLKNIYKEEELGEAPTTEDFSVVRFEGKRQVKRILRHYNLDAIVSLSYRCKIDHIFQNGIYAHVFHFGIHEQAKSVKNIA